MEAREDGRTHRQRDGARQHREESETALKRQSTEPWSESLASFRATCCCSCV